MKLKIRIQKEKKVVRDNLDERKMKLKIRTRKGKKVVCCNLDDGEKKTENESKKEIMRNVQENLDGAKKRN